MTSSEEIRPGRALVFSNLAHYYNHVIMLLFPTVALVLESEWGLSFGALLQLAFWGYLAYGLAALPAGWLGDRWSTRGMLAVYMLGTGTVTMLTGFARSPLEMGIGLTAMGLFASIYHPVGTSFIVRHAVNRGRALGANGVFGTVGVATAALIAGTLTDGWGWRMAFVVPGLVCFATGIVFLIFTDADTNQSVSKKKPDAAAPAIERHQIIRAFTILAVTMTCAGFIAQGFLVGLPKVFSERVALAGFEGITGTSSLVTLALLVGASGQLLGGRLAEHFSIKYVYLFMYVLMVPIAVSSAYLSGAPLVVGAALFQLVLASSLPAENCLVARFCPDGWHARAYGAKFVLALGVASLAVPITGLIRDYSGGFFWFFMALAGCAAMVVCFAIFLPQAGPEAVSKSEAAIPLAGPAE
ncbi:MAG: MFS transporter [Verrucomicrobia bacterium]|nr:MFS transporter [Verrucomicrobiota bacterium]